MPNLFGAAHIENFKTALDDELLKRGQELPKQNEIIKAAGNMTYPMGLRTERLAHEILGLARMTACPLKR